MSLFGSTPIQLAQVKQHFMSEGDWLHRSAKQRTAMFKELYDYEHDWRYMTLAEVPAMLGYLKQVRAQMHSEFLENEKQAVERSVNTNNVAVSLRHYRAAIMLGMRAQVGMSYEAIKQDYEWMQNHKLIAATIKHESEKRLKAEKDALEQKFGMTFEMTQIDDNAREINAETFPKPNEDEQRQIRAAMI